MTSNERKEFIINELKKSDKPISASNFAKKLSVSRQIIVGDIALLRAVGSNIIATPRGYLLENKDNPSYTIACVHTKDLLREELYTVVDCGCGLLDVIVEHPVYGQIVGNLHIFSRSDADEFIEKINQNNTEILCSITNDMHLHTLSCPSEKHFEKVKQSMKNKGFLIENT